MPNYYLDKTPQVNGEYYVHTEGCIQMPLPSDRTFLGNFNSVQAALEKAGRIHHRCRACDNCCVPCEVN
ncbi:MULTISPECIES: hypothetical protein [Vibrio]|uniref:Uncharacterized protein n=2 Tax=Vibrio TaxID=662 RepID=A0A7X4LJS6_9VIBR|nr:MULTISPECIES: hypothetical protein [Vibrio]MBF9000477.1 hypothetical protein [Vibrio nitrifigilis]MZI93255.1 hypothetical protein [Vibrio eleionomae]